MESHSARLNLAIIILQKAMLLVPGTCSKTQRGETPPNMQRTNFYLVQTNKEHNGFNWWFEKVKGIRKKYVIEWTDAYTKVQ